MFNVGYMSGNLPKALTKEEEQELFIDFQKGNQEAKNKIILHNLRLVTYLLKKFLSNNDGEELFSNGIIGLMKAVDKFDISKNLKFSTFASKCIENEMLTFIKKNKKHRKVYMQDSICFDNEGNFLTYEDCVDMSVDIEDVLENNMYRDMIKNSISKLNDTDRFIICAQYGFCGIPEMTQKDIGEKLNLSQSYVSRRQQVILDKIKKQFF